MEYVHTFISVFLEQICFIDSGFSIESLSPILTQTVARVLS